MERLTSVDVTSSRTALQGIDRVGPERRADVYPLLEALRRDQIARSRMLSWITRLRRRDLSAITGLREQGLHRRPSRDGHADRQDA